MIFLISLAHRIYTYTPCCTYAPCVHHASCTCRQANKIALTAALMRCGTGRGRGWRRDWRGRRAPSAGVARPALGPPHSPHRRVLRLDRSVQPHAAVTCPPSPDPTFKTPWIFVAPHLFFFPRPYETSLGWRAGRLFPRHVQTFCGVFDFPCAHLHCGMCLCRACARVCACVPQAA